MRATAYLCLRAMTKYSEENNLSLRVGCQTGQRRAAGSATVILVVNMAHLPTTSALGTLRICKDLGAQDWKNHETKVRRRVRSLPRD
jgi:hypothetical protein